MEPMKSTGPMCDVPLNDPQIAKTPAELRLAREQGAKVSDLNTRVKLIEQGMKAYGTWPLIGAIARFFYGIQAREAQRELNEFKANTPKDSTLVGLSKRLGDISIASMNGGKLPKKQE